MKTPLHRFVLSLSAVAFAQPAAAEIHIDGVIDSAEWAAAERITDFRRTEPWTRDAVDANRAIEALLLGTPAGIAIALRARHPAGIPRTRQRTQRDAEASVDRFNVFIDFNGDGRSGYNFIVNAGGGRVDAALQNEATYNKDWDGDWQSEHRETLEGYEVEWLLPWSVAPMRDSRAESRQLRLYIDRVIAATNERDAYPAVRLDEPRFLARFAEHEVRQFHESAWHITPYVVVVADQVAHERDQKVGADFFWKPSGDHQLVATLNPDFGQVESDELVVNFSAQETFLTDKRPFFTENQSYFDVNLPAGPIFYTRRVGGTQDGDSNAAEVDAAIKAYGSFGNLGYGVFAAEENGAAGRSFSMLRATHSTDRIHLGLSHTDTSRPAIDREGQVTALDSRFRSGNVTVQSQWAKSWIERGDQESDGTARRITVDYDPEGPWSYFYLTALTGRGYDLNDLGFSSRDNFRNFYGQATWRGGETAASSRFQSHLRSIALQHYLDDEGRRLFESINLSQTTQLRSGGQLDLGLYLQDNILDDRFLRGNGDVRFEDRVTASLAYVQPRTGDSRFGHGFNANISYGGGLGGLSCTLTPNLSYAFSDSLEVDSSLAWSRFDEWTLWDGSNRLAGYRSHWLDWRANLNWIIDSRRELRVKLQAIGIDTENGVGYLAGPNGEITPSHQPVAPFALRNLGFQIRYRQEWRPGSDLYLVYSRGGGLIDDSERGVGDVFGEAFELRDADQFLLKWSWRFDG